jgi:hypothetical protein
LPPHHTSPLITRPPSAPQAQAALGGIDEAQVLVDQGSPARSRTAATRALGRLLDRHSVRWMQRTVSICSGVKPLRLRPTTFTAPQKFMVVTVNHGSTSRTVTENARTLRFTSQSFEVD